MQPQTSIRKTTKRDKNINSVERKTEKSEIWRKTENRRKKDVRKKYRTKENQK